jgi:hypothetical protein
MEDNPCVGIEVAGTWTGTLDVEATIDGVHWFTPIVAAPAGGAGSTSFTSNGRTIATCPGAAAMRVHASTAITGTATVVLRAGNSTGSVVAAALELPTTLDNLSDVAITTPATSQTLRYNGTTWVNAKLALNDLSDVNVGTPAQGALAYRGSSVWNALAPGTAGQVLESGGAAANPSWVTATLAAMGDVSISAAAQGNLLYRGATAWNNMAPGTSGQFLKTNGAAANPSWATLALTNLTGDVTLSGVAQGDVLYRGASAWNNLAAGTAGQVLTSGGASANPSWTSIPKRAIVMALMAGFTPSGTGGDAAEYVVPYSATDGTTSLAYAVRRIDFRVSTAGGAPQATVEKYTGTSTFAATTVGSVTLGSGAYEGNQTSSFTTATLNSGDKVRVNAAALGTAAGWTVLLELEATT